jgi:hypothetical protein
MNSGKRGDHLGTKAFGILCALLGGMCLVNIPSLYKSEVDFHSKAIRATGTVVKTRVEIRHSGGASSTVFPEYISTVKFQNNHAHSFEFTATKACSSLSNCENKTVPVLYNPSHPLDARVDSGSTPEDKVKGNLVFSVVLLVLGIFVATLEPSDDNQWNKNLR